MGYGWGNIKWYKMYVYKIIIQEIIKQINKQIKYQVNMKYI